MNFGISGGGKTFIAAVFGNDDFILPCYFKKFYTENLRDKDEEEFPFLIDWDYLYDGEVFNREGLLEESEKLDIQATSALQNQFSIPEKVFRTAIFFQSYARHYDDIYFVIVAIS